MGVYDGRNYKFLCIDSVRWIHHDCTLNENVKDKREMLPKIKSCWISALNPEFRSWSNFADYARREPGVKTPYSTVAMSTCLVGKSYRWLRRLLPDSDVNSFSAAESTYLYYGRNVPYPLI